MRTLSLLLVFFATPCFAQVCFTNGHGRVIHQQRAYQAPAQKVVKQKQVYQQPVVKQKQQQVVYEDQYNREDVIDLLGELLHEQQKYTPYAEVPYQKGTTTYSVQDLNVEAFSPKDVREIIAAVSRYSTQANSGATQLMSKAQDITQQITTSVSSQSQTALQVATADAEARGVEATAGAIIAMIEALEGTRLNKQGQLSIQGMQARTLSQRVPPPPQPAAPVEGLKEYCSSCHGQDLSDPAAGFVLHAPMSEQEVMRCTQLILSGEMPKGTEIDSETQMQLLQELQGIME